MKDSRSTAGSRPALAWLMLVMAAACAGGCANYQVRLADSDPLQPQYETRTMNAFFWGLVMDPQVVVAKEADGREADAINDVVIKNNYLNNLISVVTLGIWMPIEVEYRSRAPDIDSGDFPE